MLIGFAAQLVDGALGMAYGQISSTLLISLGVPPAAASAGVHTAETCTTAVSGISHIAHRNVDWKLFVRIAVPGVVGGVLGAYVLTSIDAGTAKPFVLAYLTALGLYLFYRGVMHRHTERQPKIVAYMKPVCGWSNGVRAVFHKYGLEYEDKDIINDRTNYSEMVRKSGQPLSPCIEIDGEMLADVSGPEVEQYLVE